MEMKSISFTIYDNPVAKARARVTNKRTKEGKKITYTPEKTRVAEQSFRLQSAKWRPAEPFKGPIFLEVIFFRGIPKSFSKKKKLMAMKGKLFPLSKPDLDNMLKLVKDAMNKRFYQDDAQVCKVTAAKFYSNVPRTVIKLQEIETSEN